MPETCCICDGVTEGGAVYDLRQHPLCYDCAKQEQWCGRCRGTFPNAKLGLMGLCANCLDQEDAEHYDYQQMHREEFI